jgi:hypothetical protein
MGARIELGAVDRAARTLLALISMPTPSSSIMTLVRLLARVAVREWLVEQKESQANGTAPSPKWGNEPSSKEARNPDAQ